MADGDLLPIKVVIASDNDYRDPGASSRPFDPLCTVDGKYREQFTTQVQAVRKQFEPSLKKGLPAVVKVTLKDDAQKKSYRPTQLLNADTCPIIGMSSAGVLYASVTDSGLAKLEHKIASEDEGEIVAHLSTLKEISPFSAVDALKVAKEPEPEKGEKQKPRSLRVKLFRHGNKNVDSILDAAFVAYAKDAGVTDLTPVDYGSGVRIYKCANEKPESAEVLARFVGTQSVCQMPQFHLVRTASRSLGVVTAESFPAPSPDRDYPVVGMFDSGTDPNNAHLQAWIADRVDDWHPQSVQNNSHGSFVGALIANGKHLNFGDPRFPSASAKIVDVVVFNKTGLVEESDLVVMITESLKRFPNVRVWNLSLASDSSTCLDDEMSEFGASLDELQREHGVLFVCAAGNLSGLPLRNWPVDPSFTANDRVAPPGDGYRGLTVGGLAHLDNEKTCVKREQVAPFSRRGPGVGCVIKPEICHYAGNCDEHGNYLQTGIISLDGNGNLAEDIGVSFAAPLVASLAGNVESELRVGPDQTSQTLLKGMIVHSALVHNGPIDPAIVEYVGYGRPPDLSDILNCRQSEATVIFQVMAERRNQFYKRPFPIPACLSKTGVLKGQMFMTVIYDPPLDRNFGLEYSRRNVRATLGTMGYDSEQGKEFYERQLFPVPHDLHRRYRHDLADLGLQWSPIKMYYRKFTRGPIGREWRLSLPVLNRAECDDESPLPVTVFLTIRSADQEDQVYTEMVRAMDQLGWRVADLEIRSRPRSDEQP